ncbi:phosphatidylinositol 4-kinase [bacterium]|nr:phosphatidylinositol 4-kinase [bacterium]
MISRVVGQVPHALKSLGRGGVRHASSLRRRSPRTFKTDDGFHVKIPFDFEKIPVRKTPLVDMEFFRFRLNSPTESNSEWMDSLKQDQGGSVTYEELKTVPALDVKQSEKTINHRNMLLGFYKNPINKMQERYLVKGGCSSLTASREVLAPYLGAIFGESDHFLKTYIVNTPGTENVFSVLRRFASGYSATVFAEEGQEKYAVIPASSIVRLSAIVDILFGNTDSFNPGNLVVSDNSTLTEKKLLPIDFERSFPNEDMMEFLNELQIEILFREKQDGVFFPGDCEPVWSPGDSIIGSLDNLRNQTEIYGGLEKYWEYLFNLSMEESPNPYIYMLNHVKKLSKEEAGSIPLEREFVERVINKMPDALSAAHTLGVFNEEEIRKGKTCLQETVRQWADVLSKTGCGPTMKELHTGCYSAAGAA